MIHQSMIPQKRISVWETGVVVRGQQLELCLPLPEEGQATRRMKFPVGIIAWLFCTGFSLGFWGFLASLI